LLGKRFQKGEEQKKERRNKKLSSPLPIIDLFITVCIEHGRKNGKEKRG